jgi:hypothetical protein
MDFFSGGILGSLLGGLFRLAPEILKFFDRQGERHHELKMFELQTDLEKLRGEFRIEGRYVDHSSEQLDAIAAAFKQQGEADKRAWKWVASLSALVRPAVTYILFGMYVSYKILMISYALDSGANWKESFLTLWTAEDFGMLNMILTFWFVGRTIEKYRGSN